MALKVELVTPHIGASVTGVDLHSENRAEIIQKIRKNLDRYKVLIFHNQQLSPKSLRQFTSNFGPLFFHHVDDGVEHSVDAPEVLILRKDPNGNTLFGGACWHSDVTFQKPAGYITILHAKKIPPVGGDTLFSSTIAAFENLSFSMQSFLRSLDALHSYAGPANPDIEGLTAVHPVIRRDLITGKEGIYVNEMFTKKIIGMSDIESQILIQFLIRHIIRPEFVFRHRWKVGDVLMWDNRFTQHYPINDFTGYERLMIRCSTLELS